MSSTALFVVPITIATGGALTSTSVDGSEDPAAWDSGTGYTQGQQVSSGESIYQSVQVGTNTNHAVSDTAWWVRVGPINKMRMFDRKVGSQTEADDEIEVVITPTTLIDVISVRNLQAFNVRVVQETVGEGVVYDRTVTLDEPVGDWLEYFFNPIEMQTEAIFTGLLSYSDAEYTITIDNTGGTAKCGELLMGPAMEPGITMAGVSDGIDDYSVIAADEFGVRDIVERDFADNMDLTVYVDVARSPALKRLLTQNRASPILVIASAARPDAQVYGLAESWRRVLSFPGIDVFSITMKGLT